MTKHMLLAATALTLTLGAAQAETLRWARSGDALTLDPHAQNEGPTLALMHQMMEPLVLRNPAGELEAALATDWSVSPDNPDVWTFTLREGVKFHDGADFTAEDVVFSINRALTENSDMKGIISSVASVEATGDHEVQITTKGPNPLLPAALPNILMIDKDWAEANDTVDVQDVEGGEETFASQNVNGTGPYQLVSREADVKTEMTVFDGYWGADGFAMGYSDIVYTPIQNPSTRMAALFSGEVDFIQDVPVQDLQRIESDPNLKIVSSPQNRVIFFGLNVGDTLVNGEGENPLADPAVREAMNMAINRDAIQQVVMRGQSIPAGVIMPPFVNGWNEELNTVPEGGVEAAKAKLEEAGWGDGFTVQLDCPNDRYINDEAICQAAVGMMAQIGVTVNLNAQPKAQHFPLVNGLESDFYMLGWGVPSYDSEYIFNFLYHTKEDLYGTWNGTRYSNPELDEMIKAIAAEVDLDKRDAMIAEMWEMAKSDTVYLPIHHQVLNWAMKSGVGAAVDADDQVKVKYFTAE
ncbi:ABC transporter substrate-binding protein [Pseudoponticoccus marisrubri]|uniref:Peptide ABC transporter substrate-binding protein n=1 Tax=Pseudoponticoccus marisrubri TaxID=1685382 RepID=A0A0W7WK81_9RHOB|nr:ABC transporter substrate-binding protein [Pseudoponticoccus marisrubri]KUF10945.1 peptide ABC transporter substrate-binding protein [Pseudoponticoccus marisrubri]